MRIRFDSFAAKPGQTAEKVLIAPFTYIANGKNSARYGEIAAALGYDVLCPYRPGLGPSIISSAERRETKQRLTPGDFPELATEFAERVGKLVDGYAVRDGLFDSGAGVFGPYFADVLRMGIFRDCVNVKAPEPIAVGAARLAYHSLRPGAYAHNPAYPAHIAEGSPAQSYIQETGAAVPNAEADAWPPFAAVRRAATEANLYGNVMCSRVSQEELVGVAGNAAFPAAYFCFGKGFSGAPRQAAAFVQMLHDARAAATVYESQPTPFVSFVVPDARHPDLLNASLMAEHIVQAAAALIPA